MAGEWSKKGLTRAGRDGKFVMYVDGVAEGDVWHVEMGETGAITLTPATPESHAAAIRAGEKEIPTRPA